MATLLLEVLAATKIRDDRILAVLVATLDHEPLLAAEYLGYHGDARGIDPLRALLRQVEVAELEGVGHNDPLVDLAGHAIASLESLGAELNTGERALRSCVEAHRHAIAEEQRRIRDEQIRQILAGMH